MLHIVQQKRGHASASSGTALSSGTAMTDPLLACTPPKQLGRGESDQLPSLDHVHIAPRISWVPPCHKKSAALSMKFKKTDKIRTIHVTETAEHQISTIEKFEINQQTTSHGGRNH